MSSSTSTGNRPKYLQYCNNYCYCGMVAEIKVSNTTNNPKRLFYTCRNRACTFFLWCHPINYEGVDPENIDEEVDTEEMNIHALGRQMTHINNRVTVLEQYSTVFKIALLTMVFLMFFSVPNTSHK